MSTMGYYIVQNTLYTQCIVDILYHIQYYTIYVYYSVQCYSIQYHIVDIVNSITTIYYITYSGYTIVIQYSDIVYTVPILYIDVYIRTYSIVCTCQIYTSHTTISLYTHRDYSICHTIYVCHILYRDIVYQTLICVRL